MKKILYIVDDINYNSGAKAVTLLQMQQLKKKYDLYLLSLAEPKGTFELLEETHLLDPYIWRITEIYAESFKIALKSKQYLLSQKISRILYAISLRCGLGNVYFENLIKKRLVPILETFDTIVIVSEASKLRNMVSELKHPKKIQWIHTDYARWSDFSEWSRAVTSHDAQIYPRFDKIVVLSPNCKMGMIRKIPSLSDKIVVISNLIDGEKITRLSEEDCLINIDAQILNFVTVARIDHEKQIDKILLIANRMKKRGIEFHWYVVGDGPEREEIEKKNKEMELTDSISFLGHLENPYPVMKNCDKLVLLSKYEGTPVTIDEAMVLGIGVVAPKIGGIEEQTKCYNNVCLFDNDKDLERGLLESMNESSIFDYHEWNNIQLNAIETIV